jgi:hypothetical protein
MPDWEPILRKRLDPLGLDAERESEILRELADHLDDAFQQALERGLAPEQAEAWALASEEDWLALRRNVRSAVRGGNTMASWKESFWMPGLVSVALYIVAETAVARYNWATARRIVSPHGGTWVLISETALQMIVMRDVLPILLGASAAFLSSRMRGSFWQRLLASVFPIVAFPALGVLMLGISYLRGYPIHWSHSMLRYDHYILNYIAYLLLGAFPFLVFGSRKAPPCASITS